MEFREFSMTFHGHSHLPWLSRPVKVLSQPPWLSRMLGNRGGNIQLYRPRRSCRCYRRHHVSTRRAVGRHRQREPLWHSPSDDEESTPVARTSCQRRHHHAGPVSDRKKLIQSEKKSTICVLTNCRKNHKKARKTGGIVIIIFVFPKFCVCVCVCVFNREIVQPFKVIQG